MAEATAGPWQLTHGSGERGPEITIWGPHVDFQGSREICRMDGGCTATPDDLETEANGYLIAAAPDLYAVVKRVADHFSDTDAPLGNAARAALAKAIGEDAA